jgi:hypothetical protein
VNYFLVEREAFNDLKHKRRVYPHWLSSFPLLYRQTTAEHGGWCEDGNTQPNPWCSWQPCLNVIEAVAKIASEHQRQIHSQHETMYEREYMKAVNDAHRKPFLGMCRDQADKRLSSCASRRHRSAVPPYSIVVAKRGPTLYGKRQTRPRHSCWRKALERSSGEAPTQLNYP